MPEVGPSNDTVFGNSGRGLSGIRTSSCVLNTAQTLSEQATLYSSRNSHIVVGMGIGPRECSDACTAVRFGERYQRRDARTP
jgi:hypothetical protein